MPMKLILSSESLEGAVAVRPPKAVFMAKKYTDLYC